MPQKYDAIVIGTGQAGPSLAARLAKEGLKTAERVPIVVEGFRAAV